MTDLERAALDYARALLRSATCGESEIRTGTEASRAMLLDAARAAAARLPDRANADALRERALACRPIAGQAQHAAVIDMLEAAWESGRAYGRRERAEAARG